MKLTHRGICVADLDRSARFYKSALGFEADEDLGILQGPDVERRLQVPGARCRARTLRRADGPAILLLQFLSPPASGSRTRRSTLQYGLLHLSFYVDDIDAWAERIAQWGGAVWEQTRARYEENRTTMLYCTDPDGVRIELMHAPGETERFSHSGICVNDIGVSMAFYERMGFRPAENYVLDEGAPWLALINEVPGIKLRAQMMRDTNGNTIELLKVFHPACFGPREMQPMNRFGLSHMVIEDEPCMDTVDIFHRADPDGDRIETLPSAR